MGLTKFEVYELQDIEVAEKLKALAHPARVYAVRRMIEVDVEMNCQQLKGDLNLSQPAFSKHLKQLAEAGIIKSRTIIKGGKAGVLYKVNEDALLHIRQWLAYVERLAFDSNLHDSHADRLYFNRFVVKTDWLNNFRI